MDAINALRKFYTDNNINKELSTSSNKKVQEFEVKLREYLDIDSTHSSHSSSSDDEGMCSICNDTVDLTDDECDYCGHTVCYMCKSKNPYECDCDPDW